MTTSQSAKRTGGIPRGLSQTGPVLFSYGFRPFFLGGAVWAFTAMVLWLAALSGRLDIAGEYGVFSWHAHEMLFGYASAVLAGFLLTAVPNWTGRLPVSGWPLFGLFLLWLVGRLAFLASDAIGVRAAVALDMLFMPALLFICVREVVAGRKWNDLKVITGLLALTLANAAYHYEVIASGQPDRAYRLAIAAYVGLIMVIGGRIIPSFTRNWINRLGRKDFPVPFNSFDTAAIVTGVVALGLWVALPESRITAAGGVIAAAVHTVRLSRWRGWTTFSEMLVAILHVAYLFVPLGFLAIALSAIDIIDAKSALHVVTIGTVALMMLAVTTRATRGHTGRDLTASPMTTLSYGLMVLCALARPAAGFLPDHAPVLYTLSGALWLAAFALFIVEYGPMLVRTRRKI
ncbi:NnrS family protein [Rhizobium sp. ARZ01]|uniref:NnrS family protein n=1 Tax=Rhizobium sp. ARZ01 TaxID=2769313 RepID=UPI0017832CC8|nr:NnrS family protein [Rhizobium sp. ARZ01]MBD9371145.1 NnrS family protein [Rhizobium sp. ARZ01]